MSKTIFANAFTAEGESPAAANYDVYEPAKEVAGLKKFGDDISKVVTLPDRRAYRSMNRSAVILAGACLEAKSVIDEKVSDRFKVGFYCATDNGPDNFSCAKSAPVNTSEDFATYYKKNRSPKDYLKQLPNLVPAQISIFMELTGLLNVYNNSEWGGLQALDQAEFDLSAGIVDYAFVTATLSLDDPLRAERRRSEIAADRFLCEGAGVLLLERDDTVTNWKEEAGKLGEGPNFFGIADSVVRLAQK